MTSMERENIDIVMEICLKGNSFEERNTEMEPLREWMEDTRKVLGSMINFKFDLNSKI